MSVSLEKAQRLLSNHCSWLIILYAFGKPRGAIEQLRRWVRIAPFAWQDPADKEERKACEAQGRGAQLLEKGVFVFSTSHFFPVWSLRERGAKANAALEILEGRDRHLLQTKPLLRGCYVTCGHPQSRSPHSQVGDWDSLLGAWHWKIPLLGALSLCWSGSLASWSRADLGVGLKWIAAFTGRFSRWVADKDDWSLSLRGISCDPTTSFLGQFRAKAAAI